MRSIPRCSKAVFYVFVFGPIDDSATMYNHCPSNFPLSLMTDLCYILLSHHFTKQFKWCGIGDFYLVEVADF